MWGVTVRASIHRFGAAILLAAVASPASTIAATDSASLDVVGTIPAIVAITVTPTGTASSLDLTPNAIVTALKVADIAEMANTPEGYSVTVTSANLAAGGRCPAPNQACLWNAAANSAVELSFLRDTSPQTFTGSAATWVDTTSPQLDPLVSAAAISYFVGPTMLPHGAYTETLTFTIASK